jgi:hypothetical protein
MVVEPEDLSIINVADRPPIDVNGVEPKKKDEKEKSSKHGENQIVPKFAFK